ncbi:MAG: hypothetical protein ACR2KC_06570 [Acidimicrobiales bacterium]
MPPAAKSAPADYLFALAVSAVVVGTSFLVEPALTRWIVFGVGVAMVLGVLAVGMKPAKRQGPEGRR